MEKNNNKTPPEKNVIDKRPSTKKKVGLSLLFLVIAALTIWAVISQSKSFSLAKFADFLTSASPWWLTAAVAGMAGFIIFEGVSLICISKEFGYRRSFGSGFVYSSADIYFSAITPSATGGQPASAYFMYRDGIPGSLATVILLVNLLMYNASTVFTGILSTLIKPSTISNFSTVSKILIAIGFVTQTTLLIGLMILLTKEKILHTLGNIGLSILGKLKILRRIDERKANLAKSMEDYKRYSSMIKGKRGMLAKAFVFNFLQRVSQILVTVFAYFALGNPISSFGKIFALQNYVSIGAYCVPIPGAMGVTDYLMIDGFEGVMSKEQAVNFELLSRSISFYSCIIICGVTILISYLLHKNRRSEI